jgi:hypothetical protein
MQPVCSLFPTGTDTFRAAFRSPATRTRFRVPFQGQRSWPCSFLHPPDLHRIRSSPMLQNALPVSAPLLGFLCPSGSKRSTGLALRKPTYASRPISFRSPWPDSIKMMSAADQRSGIATSREVRCFRKPLGTRTIMRSMQIPVN